MKAHLRRAPSKRWLFACVVLLFLLWACVFYAYHPVQRGGGPSLPSTPSSSRTARIRAFTLSLVTPPASANPWRGSFLRGRLDWHDLVPNTHRVGVKGEAAAEALSRHLREEAKTTLLALLQGSWGVYSLRARRGGGGVRGQPYPRKSPQGELVGALEAVARAKGVPLLAVLADGEEVARSALTLGMAEDDISEEREVRVGGGPLTALEACPIVRDPCLLHATLLACTSSPLCGWCPASSTCLTRGGGGGVGCMPSPGAPRGDPVGGLTLSMGSPVGTSHNLSSTTALRDLPAVLLVSALRVPAAMPGGHPGQGKGGEEEEEEEEEEEGGGSRCTIRLTDTPITVSISGNSKMAYHWATETLPGWVAQAKRGPGGLLGEVDTLVVYEGDWNPLLAQAYIFSGACPRQKEEGVMSRVCATKQGGAAAALDAALGEQKQLVAIHATTDAPLALFSTHTSAPVWEPLPLAVQAGHRLSLATARGVLSALAQGGGGENEAWIQAGGGLPQGVTLGEVMKEAAWLATHGLALPVGGGDFASLAAAVCLGGGEGEGGGEGGVEQELEDQDQEEQEVGGAEEGEGKGSPPLVLILSRLNKRLLLNEPDLVRLVYALGGTPRVIALEGMPLCTQVRLFRRAKVLLGMHGSGLINSMFMKKGSSLVQVVPYKLAGADAFFKGTAISRGVSYHEIPTHGRDRVIPHGHFLKEPKDTEKVLEQGSGCCGQQTYFSFWINQDVVVDLKEADRVLRVALGLK